MIGSYRRLIEYIRMALISLWPRDRVGQYMLRSRKNRRIRNVPKLLLTYLINESPRGLRVAPLLKKSTHLRFHSSTMIEARNVKIKPRCFCDRKGVWAVVNPIKVDECQTFRHCDYLVQHSFFWSSVAGVFLRSL